MPDGRRARYWSAILSNPAAHSNPPKTSAPRRSGLHRHQTRQTKNVATTSSVRTCAATGTPTRGSSHFRAKSTAKVIVKRRAGESVDCAHAGPAMSCETGGWMGMSGT
jgi:hypothetical protein